MRNNRFRALAATCLAICVPLASGDPVCIDGICFVDRAASGEIVLGNIRGSIAVLDYDNDGYPDLAIADVAGLPHRLFHNEPGPGRGGTRTFVDVTRGSGLDDADGTARGAGATVAADYDNDGDTDIFILGRLTSDNSFGLLYRNDGGGQFTNMSVPSGIRVSGYIPESASWTDYDLDGYPDLLVCNLLGSIKRAILWHNNGNGTFTDMTDLLPPYAMVGHVYAHAWNDYDHDGYADAFLLQNGGPTILLKNVDNGAGGRTFVNTAVAAGFVGLGPAPMGIAAGDYDRDGDLDLAITDGLVGTYYRNDNGVLVEFYPFATFFGWGITWIDVDNDGWIDNYQAGSWGSPNIDRLNRNLGGGQFANISPALNTTALPSQYSVQLDFNHDGRQDLITINVGEFISVYENVSTVANHWITVKLVGDGDAINHDAIGAQVKLSAAGLTHVSEVVSGSSTTATEDLRQHFGLATATVVDRVEVLWPRQGSLACRTEVFLGPLTADQIVTLVAGAGFVLGDVNGDNLVNLADVAAFGACLSGPAQGLSTGCAAADHNFDAHVDLIDIAALQRSPSCD